MKHLVLNSYSYLKNKYLGFVTSHVLNSLWKETSKDVKLKELTAEQKQAIQDYWEPLVSKKVSTRWHQLIYSITGVFKPEYEPFDIAMKVQNTLSPAFAQRAFDDKGLYHQLLNGFEFPTRVALCSYGVYYLPESGGLIEVSFDEFINGLLNITDCIIKPCKGTDGGRGVSSLDVVDGEVLGCSCDIKTYIIQFQNSFGYNYCVERKVHECENLQCLNPTSCNTLRVHTYRSKIKQEIQFLSSYIRIGKMGKVVDNAHSGGYCGRISQDGYLDRITRVYPYKCISVTESGVDISHYKIEGFDRIINMMKRAHSQLPMFDLVGWDVTIDTEGKVVIIEFNPNPDMRLEQCIFDYSCLGGYQEEIIKRVYQ